MKGCIDDLIANTSDIVDFTVALSTAYDWIYQSIRALRLNAEELTIHPPMKLSVLVYYNLAASIVRDLFLVSFRWNALHHIIIQPP